MVYNLHYAKVFFNPYLLGEAHLHDDVDVKEALNKFLWKTTHVSTAYALVLRNFVDFVESQGSFSDTPPMKDLDLFPHKC